MYVDAMRASALPSITLLLCFSAVALEGTAAAAQSPVVLHRLTGPVVLDGMSDEPAWQDVAPFPMTMYQPTYQGQMTERTEIRAGYDDHYLYLSGRFYDSEPAGILASSLYRDGGTAADDYFNIGIDPFNDNLNTLWFWTTPAGIRGDAALANDGEGDGAYNESWDTFWDVATVQNDAGWFAEVRIPFSSLGFQADGGEVVMGLVVSRVISRKNERHVYPNIPPNWQFGFVKPSVAQDVLLHGVSARRPLYLTPYALGGVGRTVTRNDAGDTFLSEKDLTDEIGLDARYSVASNLNLDVSVNTDFAQVEADDQVVNLTRFSQFFPEKRPFFQERAGIFSYEFGFQQRLFHSRQIGLHDGVPVRILGGARLVGRAGRWDVGLLDMQTDASAALPAENFGVARLRRTVVNANSYAGGMLTTRLGVDGGYNVVYGLDADVRVTGDEYVSARWAQSIDDAVVAAGTNGLLASSAAQLRWERRRHEGFNYRLWLTRWGRTFRPDVGFYTRTDYWQSFDRLTYDWLPGPASPFRLIQSNLFGILYFRNDGGAMESGNWGLLETFEFKSGAQIRLEVEGNHEDLHVPATIAGGTEVPAGRYTFADASLRYQMANGRRFRANVSLKAGSFYDGSLVEATVEPTWNASRFVEVGGVYRLNRVRFGRRDTGFDAHVVQLRAKLALDTRLSAGAFVQLNSLADFVVANVRLRYNFRERTDLWIVYDEGLNTDRYRVTPALPLSSSRKILIKYTYTFGL